MKTSSSFFWNRAVHQLLSLATGLAIVLAGAPSTAFAQGKGSSPQRAAETGFAKSTRAQGHEQRKGIRVHGNWTITIRNADRSVASRHEFQNALVAPGLLAKLLAHGGTASDWFVFVYGGVCQDVDGTGTQVCMIGERALPSLTGTSSNLVVTVPSAGPHANALVLEGSIKTSFAGPIVQVDTQVSICAPGIPLPCPFPVGGGILTRRDTIPLNINVQAGQTIDVKVVISFS